ncbi:MAG: pilus (MSHA type) biogenesis protein MshL [Thiomargarita sp.]|nr:pilus (MSHA type) biogenesis protein MshL [Thiomargarita sp.]
MKKYFYISILLFSACAPQPPIPSPGHLNKSDVAQVSIPQEDIPPLLQQYAPLPKPRISAPLEVFTVVVDAVAIRELLFALARDAKLNIDIHSGITGTVTLNAFNQTLPQLLERIAKQVDLRYQIDGDLLTISPDLPYMQLYKIDYVNMSRESKSTVTVSTQIASTGGGISQGGEGGGSGSSGGEGQGNTSDTEIVNTSNNQFWETLNKNLNSILKGMAKIKADFIAEHVILNPETGVINIYATHKQHYEVQRFLDRVLMNAQKQVLIEVTIAEVKLSDQYQAGIDWQRIDGDFSYSQFGNNVSPFYSFSYNNPESSIGSLFGAVNLLEQFGSVKVLSSPKVMALNNQTAILKVVDNIVYFTSEVDISESETSTRETFTTEIHTVPVGLVMNITPQISETNTVILNIRPTISRIIGYKNDPNPLLAEAGTVNRIPEIQVREIESILKMNNGEIAVIGGLMQDVISNNRTGIPILSHLPLIGDLFSYRDDVYEKTELIIFIRPIVADQASLATDLRKYQIYLPDTQPDVLAPTGLTR